MRFSKMSALLFVILTVFVLPAADLEAQTPGNSILQSYERIFVRSNLSTKVNVLLDAANDEAADQFYGAFCELALRFVLANAPLFPNDPDMINITVGAVKGVREYSYSPAVEILWQVFLRFPDNAIRIEILETLPALNTQDLAERAADFLAEQNNLLGSADPQMLLALFAVLGKIGDDSSYPVLFASSLLYSGELEKAATNALYGIDDDLTAFLMKVILNNSPEEKLEALKIAAAGENLSAEQTGSLAEAALEFALASPSGERWNQNRTLTDLSIRLIRETERVAALPLVLKHFSRSLDLFMTDPSQRQPLLDTIVCLAALKSSDGARLLSLQLGIYNSRAGTLRPEEQEVALAMISALGSLGYKVSRDSIYQASRLPYPKEIQDSAKKALSQLKW